MVKLRIFIILLLLSPAAMGGGAADAKVIKTGNLEQLIAELADWSRPHAGPGEYRVVHKVSFCQKRTKGAPMDPASSCRPMLYATGVQSLPSYVQVNATQDSDVPRTSGDWYRVTPDWHDRLWKQFRYQSSWLDEYLIFWSTDADKQMQEVADWSLKFESPRSHRKPQKIHFCELRQDETSTSPFGTESCNIVLLMRGGLWTPGYVRFADAHGVESKRASVSWFRLTPEWDKTLKARIQRAEMVRSMSSPGQEYAPTPSNMPEPDLREYLNMCPTCKPGAN